MSAIGLPDQSYLSVTIGGVDLPLRDMRFCGLLLTEHHLYNVPMGQLKFIDNYGIMSTIITPADGLEIVITLGRTEDATEVYTHRIFSARTRPSSDGVEYNIYTLASQASWLLNDTTAGIRDTSSNALGQLAASCGLEFEGDATNDNQVWLPLREPSSAFARRIARSGYVDAQSCMMLGVTLKGTLRYRNLSANSYNDDLPTFTQGIEGPLWVTSWSMNNNSGLNNYSGGYKTTTNQFNPSSAATTQATDVAATRISDNINVNKDVAQGVIRGKSLILPINAGNNHDNYLAAIHQNARLKQMLSQSVSILTPFDAKVELFDSVVFNNYVATKTGGIEKDLATSGYYVSAGKSINMLPDLSYCERYQLIRDGFNNDQSNITY